MQLSFWHTSTGAVSFIPAVSGGAPVPSYSNPDGTGDRTSTVTATTDVSVTGSITNSVDGVSGEANTTDAFYFNNATPFGKYIQWEFGEAKYISEITWKQNNTTTQGTWRWQGSNDGVGWTDLSGEVQLNATTKVMALSTVSPNGYTKYRLSHVRGSVAATTWMYEVEFKIDTGTVLDISGVASYGNPGGVGDRSALITVTKDIGTTGSISNSVNGVLSDEGSTNGWYFAGGANTGKWVKWEFNAAKHVEEITWYQNNSNNQGSWKWQGSNDDATWTDLSSTFALNATKNVVALDLIGASDTYTYYRMLGVGGNNIAVSTWMHEIEFKLTG